jgi:hypothetical protein
VAQLFVGMVKGLAHALPIGVAELSQCLTVLSNSLLNKLVAFFGSCRQMLSLLAYDTFSRRWVALQLPVLLQQAPVHHHRQPGGPGARGSLLMDYAFLHPYGLRAHPNSCIYNFGH